MIDYYFLNENLKPDRIIFLGKILLINQIVMNFQKHLYYQEIKRISKMKNSIIEY